MHLIGHEDKLNQLRAAVKAGKLPHAYLFSGLDGIGKKLIALRFIKELFCENKSACGVCLPCQKAERNTHPDLFIISAEKKDITIEQAREMQSKLQMHPLEAKYKMVIIDDAERMNNASANAMLKTLEEPPSATHFFLITSREHMLLPTIISRCQRLIFSPLKTEEIISFVQKKLGVDIKTAKILADISGGSLSFALSVPLELINEVTAFAQKLLLGGIRPPEILLTAEKWSRSDMNHSAILAVLAKAYYKDQNSKISAIFSVQSDIEGTFNKQLLFEQLLFYLTPQNLQSLDFATRLSKA